MYEVEEDELDEINQPTELFTKPGKLDPTKLKDNETTPSKNHQDNGASLTHSTQPSTLY